MTPLVAEAEEHRALRSVLRDYLELHAPGEVVNRLDDAGEYPESIIAGLAELGIFGLNISAEFGGSGADLTSVAIVCEELQRAGLSLLSAVAPTITYCAPAIERFGSDELKREILPRVATGGLRMAIGLTESDVGSDLSRTSASARTVDGGFVVRGTKVWSTGAARADFVVTLVRSDPAVTGYGGLSVLLVPAKDPAVTVRKIPKFAGQATASCEVFIEDLFVPDSRLVGEVNDGRRVFFAALDSERLFVAAQCVGIAQGAYETALSYALSREQFGKPIIEHQAVAHKLADMAARLTTARLLTYSLARTVSARQEYSLEAALAKVYCSEAATAIVNDGMAILGAYSYAKEYPMERYYREVKLLEIAAGTNQILRNVIAKRLPGARL
jgi:alkylation response protein AidB-like acyl-CoA dehydrogenase